MGRSTKVSGGEPIEGVTFGGVLCILRDNGAIVRIEDKTGAAYKVKVKAVYDDFVVVYRETGGEYMMPFGAIVSLRDVTAVPSFEWRGNGKAEEHS